jgi:hypothetical protein
MKRFKAKRFEFDYKDTAADVVNALKPYTRRGNWHVFDNPESLYFPTDTYGYIVTNDKWMTVAQYRRLYRDDVLIDGLVQEFRVKDTDLLTKLIEKVKRFNKK